jgi:hypothetical protein
MHPYPGIDDANAVIPGSPAAGYGAWPGTIQIPDDADKRDAANAEVGMEALTDRSNYLAWRSINIVDGGSYTFTTPLSLRNPWTVDATTLTIASANGTSKIRFTGSDSRIEGAALLRGTITQDTGGDICPHGIVGPDHTAFVSTTGIGTIEAPHGELGPVVWTLVEPADNRRKRLVLIREALITDASGGPGIGGAQTINIMSGGVLIGQLKGPYSGQTVDRHGALILEFSPVVGRYVIIGQSGWVGIVDDDPANPGVLGSAIYPMI